jgi:hypothetical protein
MKTRTKIVSLVAVILAIIAIIGIIIAGGIIGNEIIIAEEKNLVIQNGMDDEAGIIIRGGIPADDDISKPVPIGWMPDDEVAGPMPIGW